jgi:hypothetical protein
MVLASFRFFCHTGWARDDGASLLQGAAPKIGEDINEVLDVIPAILRVLRTIRLNASAPADGSTARDYDCCNGQSAQGFLAP